jgi:sugar lactone lactonase YvrE
MKRTETAFKMSSLIVRNRKGLQYSPLAGVLALFAVVVIAAYGNAMSGNVTADLVLGQIDFNSNTPSLSQSQLSIPVGVAVDRRASPNFLYVVDAGNNRVLGWTLTTLLANGASADLVLGQQTFLTSYSGGGLASLNEPSGAAVDSSGNLFVADTGNNRVLLYNTPFNQTKVPPCSSSNLCMGQSAEMVIGQPTSGGLCNGGALMPSASSLCGPASVAVDGKGNLYVADSGNNRVLEFFTPTGPQNPSCPGTGTNPGCPGDLVADRVLGQGATDNIFITSQCGVGQDSMCDPEGVAVDSLGNVYVSDSNNNRVLEFDPGNVVADRVYGQVDFSANVPTGNSGDDKATSTGLNLPSGVTIDTNDNLYVVDSNNNRILAFISPLTNVAANLVFGQGSAGANFAFNSCNSPLGNVSLCYSSGVTSPGYLAFDSGSNLFAVDSLNSRVLEYFAPLAIRPTPTMTPVLPTPTPTPTATSSGKLKVVPLAIRFQTTKIGTTAKQKVTITNKAETVLSGTIEGNNVNPPFRLQLAGGFDLTQHQKKEFSVIFKPTSRGRFTSQITIDSSDGTNSVLLIPVEGNSR